MPRLSIIVPTYREADNLANLTHRIAAALHDAACSFEIIIVDDNSPDETVRVCEELAARLPVKLVVRTSERGLSSAVIAGMERAEGELLICMDADLSHPPESLPELVAALENPATDFVIGSRYVRGGSTEEGWGLFRWLNSKGATLLARPLTSAKDPMAGFFGLRREDFVKAKDLNPIGYKIGLELLVKCGCCGVKEVPIRFANRRHGASKLSLREQLNYLRHLRRLYRFRFGDRARGAEFLLVGCSGALVDLGCLSLLLTELAFEVSRPIAILTAMAWNIILQCAITSQEFGDDSIAKQHVRSAAACAVGASVNWLTSIALIQSISALAEIPLIAAAIGLIAGTGASSLLFNTLLLPRCHDDKTSCTREAVASAGSPPSARTLDRLTRSP